MPTPICLICDERKGSTIGFLVQGAFSKRAQVPPSNFNSKLGLELQQKWNTLNQNGRKLWLCKSCASSECGKDGSNILGFLTPPQHAAYMRDAALSMQLRNEGYLVLEKKQWSDWLLQQFDANALGWALSESNAKPDNLKDHQGCNRKWASMNKNDGSTGSELVKNAIMKSRTPTIAPTAVSVEEMTRRIAVAKSAAGITQNLPKDEASHGNKRIQTPDVDLCGRPSDVAPDNIIHADIRYGIIAKRNYLKKEGGGRDVWRAQAPQAP